MVELTGNVFLFCQHKNDNTIRTAISITYNDATLLKHDKRTILCPALKTMHLSFSLVTNAYSLCWIASYLHQLDSSQNASLDLTVSKWPYRKQLLQMSRVSNPFFLPLQFVMQMKPACLVDIIIKAVVSTGTVHCLWWNWGVIGGWV